MSGFQEILIVILIVLGILFIPRMTGRRATAVRSPISKRIRISPLLRLAVVVSVLWPLGAAIYYRPWQDASISFYAYGLGPVVIGWGLYWVLDGFKGRGR